MKIQLQYSIVMHDDEGNLVADAEASLNVGSVKALIDTITGVASHIINKIEDDRAASNAKLDAIFARASASNPQ